MSQALCCVTVLVWAVSLQTADASTLSVVDEAGKPIAEFDALFHTADHGYTNWTAGRDGRVEIRGVSSQAPLVDVVVRAKDYAPAVVSFSGGGLSALLAGRATVVLERGQAMDLDFRLPDGMSLPDDLKPEVYFTRFAERVRTMRQPENAGRGEFKFDVVNARRTGDSRYTIRLPLDPLPFYIAIHRPGFLQLFEAGPYDASDVVNGVLKVDVPRPATIDVTFDAGDIDHGEVPYASSTYSVLWQQPHAEISYCTVAHDSSEGMPHRFRCDDLAPATYLIEVRTTPKPGIQPAADSEINPGAFFDRRILALQPGGTAQIEFRYTPFDPHAWHGERSVTVRIENPDGSAAIGEKLKIGYFDGHYGMLPVFEGAVPHSGEVQLTGVTARRTASAIGAPFGSYFVTINDGHVGDFDVPSRQDGQPFRFQIPIRAGDPAPEVELADVSSGLTVRLKEFRGQVAFVEFWSATCGPCQPAMNKLNKFAAEHETAWKDRVAVVAVSIDDSREAAAAHIASRGWTALRHFWSGGEETGMKSPAARSFVIDAIPVAFLIDSEGRVVWRGNPLTDDGELADRIERLLDR